MKVPAKLWLVWAAVGLFLEGVALGNGLGGDTLTETILLTFPGWIIYGLLGWLLWHFRGAR